MPRLVGLIVLILGAALYAGFFVVLPPPPYCQLAGLLPVISSFVYQCYENQAAGALVAVVGLVFLVRK